MKIGIRPKTKEEAEKEWKAQRQLKVDNIEVTYKGVIYQGDEKSQDRLSRAINALPDEITTIQWVAKDNSLQILNKRDLTEILFNAGMQQATIWNEGRPE